MRAVSGFLMVVTLMGAPAFAQSVSSKQDRATEPADRGAAPLTLPGAAAAGSRVLAIPGVDGRTDAAGGLSFGVLDKLTFTDGAARPALPLAPIETDKLALAWRPGGKWGISLDLTSRGENEVLPQEELSAGAYYQVTPRLRFGGGVTLNGDSLRSAADGWKEKNGEAGIRFESAFAF